MKIDVEQFIPDAFEKFMIRISDGNIGAMTFVMSVLKDVKLDSYTALQRMASLNITGEKLYLLWNDCCDRNNKKTINVMLKKSYDEILDHIDMQKNQGRGKPFDED